LRYSRQVVVLRISHLENPETASP